MDCGGGRGRIEQYVGMLLCLALHGPEWGGGGGAEILFTPHRTFYRHTAATCPPSTFYFMVITPSCRIRKQQQKHQSDKFNSHPHFITRHELHIFFVLFVFQQICQLNIIQFNNLLANQKPNWFVESFIELLTNCFGSG